MKKTGQAVQTALAKVDRATVENLEAAHKQSSMSDALQLLGAIRATQTLGLSISAQSFRALIRFRDEKGHEALSFSRFDDFLENFPTSPMSKSQFYERLNAIEREGDDMFDLLNSMKIPLSTRKQLREGLIRVEGEIIVLGENDKEVQIPLNDSRAVAGVLRDLAEKTAAQLKQIAKQSETIKKGKEELKAKQQQLDQSASYAQPPYERALFNLIGAFTVLRNELEGLPAHERKQKRDYTLKQIADQRLLLEELFNIKAPKLSKKEHDAGLGAVIEELFEEM
jgi:hypothetical protein